MKNKSKSRSKSDKKIGRPTKYNNDLGNRICYELLEGKSLRQICLSQDMPDKATICRWASSNDKIYESFRNQYAQAREFQGDLEFDDIRDIIHQDPKYLVDDKGNKRIDTGWVQLQRLKVDAIKWRASKLKAKKYGGDSAIIANQMSERGQSMPALNIVLSDSNEDK